MNPEHVLCYYSAITVKSKFITIINQVSPHPTFVSLSFTLSYAGCQARKPLNTDPINLIFKWYVWKVTWSSN